MPPKRFWVVNQFCARVVGVRSSQGSQTKHIPVILAGFYFIAVAWQKRVQSDLQM